MILFTENGIEFLGSPMEADPPIDYDRTQVWSDIRTLRRLAVVGETAMAEGFDPAPFTDGLPKAAEEAWGRLRGVFENGGTPSRSTDGD